MRSAVVIMLDPLLIFSFLCFPECDSCAQTLLHDLEKLDDELERVKAQLGNVTASASSQDRLKKLEKAMADTKVT